MEPNIREYIDEDIDFYLQGEIEAFQSTYPGISVTKDMKKEFKDNVLRSVVSGASKGFTLEDKRPIGFVMLATQNVFNTPVGYIENIYVIKEVRNKGFGRRLLKFAEEFCRKEGCGILQLDVSVYHKAAFKLYESEGFAITSYKMEKIIAI